MNEDMKMLRKECPGLPRYFFRRNKNNIMHTPEDLKIIKDNLKNQAYIKTACEAIAEKLASEIIKNKYGR